MYENDDDDDENNNENEEHRKLYDLLNGSIFETKKPTNFNEIEQANIICTVITCTQGA